MRNVHTINKEKKTENRPVVAYLDSFQTEDGVVGRDVGQPQDHKSHANVVQAIKEETSSKLPHEVAFPAEQAEETPTSYELEFGKMAEEASVEPVEQEEEKEDDDDQESED